MNTDHFAKVDLKLAWLAPWSFGSVTVLEYLFITGFSSLIEEHDENALEDACTAYFLEVQTKYFDMFRNQLSYGLPGPPVQLGHFTLFDLSASLHPRAEVPEIQVPIPFH